MERQMKIQSILEQFKGIKPIVTVKTRKKESADKIHEKRRLQARLRNSTETFKPLVTQSRKTKTKARISEEYPSGEGAERNTETSRKAEILVTRAK